MADNFRIKIEDLEGNGSLHGSKEKSQDSKVLPEKETAGGSQSFNGKLQSNSSGNSSVELESNASKLNRDASKEIRSTDIDVDVYSEDPALSYEISETDAEYAEMIARLGDAYGKIFNIDANDADTAKAVEELGLYGKTLDPKKMNALAKGLIYGTLQEVISNMNAGDATGPGGNDGGSGNGTGDGYSGINQEGSNNPSNKAFDINIPISDLGLGENPYEDVLPAIDEMINEMYPSEIDYSEVNNEAGLDDVDSNAGLSKYTKVGSIDTDDEHISKWDLRAMPDAMSNMYDVYFRICDNDTNVDGEHLTPGLNGVDNLFGSRLLSARIQTIEIPAYERQTTEMSAWGTKIERPTDVINTPGQSSFSIRGDTRLLYIDFMNILSGTTMADYFDIGANLFDVADKTAIQNSKTARYMREASTDIKNAQEKMEKAIESIKKQEKEDVDTMKGAIANEYVSMKTDAAEQQKFIKSAQEKAKKDGTSYAQASYELMLEANSSKQQELQKKLKEIKAAESNKDSDKYWAAQKEKRAKMTEIKNQLKELSKEQREANKKVNDIVSDAASKIRGAKASRAIKVISAVLRNRPIALSNSNSQALAYVTGAIARNMSVRCASAPFESFEDLSNHKRVDIIVKRTPQGGTFTSTLTPKKDERFIFEDVKLLGTSNGIQFKRESADVQDFTYNFIYKRFYKLDYYTDDASAWVNSQLDYWANWCVDWSNDQIKSGAKAVRDAFGLK